MRTVDVVQQALEIKDCWLRVSIEIAQKRGRLSHGTGVEKNESESQRSEERTQTRRSASLEVILHRWRYYRTV